MLDFSLLENSRNPSAPVCSQFSKESRWGVVQWSCHLQLQRSVENSDVRKRDVNPSWPMTEMVRWGEVRSKVVHTVPDLEGLLLLPVQTS